MNRDSHVRRFIAVAECFIGLLALHVACDSTEASLPRAVYAEGVPVYPDAKYVGAMGGQSSDSIGEPVTAESQSWFIKISDPTEQEVAFYKKGCPAQS
jgi:hypothetical protein